MLRQLYFTLFIFSLTTNLNATIVSNKFDVEEVSKYIKSDNVNAVKDYLSNFPKKQYYNAQFQPNKDTIVMIAAKNSSIRVLSYLLALKMNPNLCNKSKTCPLHIAARKNNISIVKLLIKNNAQINNQDAEGYTSIMRAIMFKNFDIVDVLTQHNADLYIKNKDNQTICDIAINIDDPIRIKNFQDKYCK